jgi:dephospho-CoA kinase
MWTEALAAASGVAVVVIPLLFEVGVEKQFDSVVVTGCSHATQVARLTAKGLTPAQAEARIRAQLPVMLKMDRGNFVIWNDGGRGPLAAQAGMIWDQFKEK